MKNLLNIKTGIFVLSIIFLSGCSLDDKESTTNIWQISYNTGNNYITVQLFDDCVVSNESGVTIRKDHLKGDIISITNITGSNKTFNLNFLVPLNPGTYFVCFKRGVFESKYPSNNSLFQLKVP